MEKNSIVFQAFDKEQDRINATWYDAKIIYVLEDVDPGYDVTGIADAISAVLGNTTVRFTRFSAGEEISLALALKKSGGYYQSRCTHNYK